MFFCILYISAIVVIRGIVAYDSPPGADPDVKRHIRVYFGTIKDSIVMMFKCSFGVVDWDSSIASCSRLSLPCVP